MTKKESFYDVFDYDNYSIYRKNNEDKKIIFRFQNEIYLRKNNGFNRGRRSIQYSYKSNKEIPLNKYE